MKIYSHWGFNNFIVALLSLAKALALIISVTTASAPFFLQSSLKGTEVIPAIGAKNNLLRWKDVK